MKKKFDCVAMKHAGAEKIQHKLAGFSLKDELEFWKQRSIELRDKKERLKRSNAHKTKT